MARRTFLLALAALALTGCQVAEVAEPQPHRIVVKRIDHGTIDLGTDGLSRREAEEIAERIAFAAGSKPAALEIVLVGAGPLTRQSIEAIAARYGVPGRNVIAGRPTEVAKAGGVFVLLQSYVAIPPECRQRLLIGAAPGSIFTDQGFGCATLVDLALSVANPKDLLGNEGVVLQDGARAAEAVAEYRGAAAVSGVTRTLPTTVADQSPPPAE